MKHHKSAKLPGNHDFNLSIPWQSKVQGQGGQGSQGGQGGQGDYGGQGGQVDQGGLSALLFLPKNLSGASDSLTNSRYI